MEAILQSLAAVARGLWIETDGQDLVEYALLLAFVSLTAISILTGIKTSMNSIWTKVNSTVSSAAAS